ncbi:hypothetical protein GWI33_017520 [Rhynchophorus ferrugineus]|uniref:Uncharacterized protein n=1 Tax=Rhynchophorus ferrugineus TaxID=354439 RepID=A0A834HWL7_RHYFE|nr:hypothetical protein GWI33_017520 [Rhynchophorus ferrugineus]
MSTEDGERSGRPKEIIIDRFMRNTINGPMHIHELQMKLVNNRFKQRRTGPSENNYLHMKLDNKRRIPTG